METCTMTAAVYAIFFCMANKPLCININQQEFASKSDCIRLMKITADGRPTVLVSGRLYVRRQDRKLWYECVRIHLAPWQMIGPIPSRHLWAD